MGEDGDAMRAMHPEPASDRSGHLQVGREMEMNEMRDGGPVDGQALRLYSWPSLGLPATHL